MSVKTRSKVKVDKTDSIKEQIEIQKAKSESNLQSITDYNREISEDKFEIVNKNQNKIEKAEPKMATENDLSELIKVLTLKINEDKNKPNNVVTVDIFAKIISDFNGKNIPVKKWFQIFEENAEAYELNIKQMYVHARYKITGAAKAFIETESVSDYEQLKYILISEFDRKYDSFEIHKMLSGTKKKHSESFYEYVLNMKRIANLADIEERATIRYIVNGVDITDNFKVNLYSAKTFRE